MKVEYINPFINAVKKVLSTMASTESEHGRPSLKEEGNRIALGDVSAMIELSGESRGSVGVSFSKDCILQIAKQMFGEDYTEINEGIKDMVGEIVNMVSGEARRELEKMGFNFSAGIPTTFSGDKHELKHSVATKTILIPFTTKAGAYYVEVCFDTEGLST